MIELRYNTEQVIRVGVFLAKQTEFADPVNPISGFLLEWCYWRHIVKAEYDDTGQIVWDIVTRTWEDIPNCAGCYFLTLTAADTDCLGPLVLYIYNANLMKKPIFMEFEVVSQYFWDAKYSNNRLEIESQAQKG